MSGAKGEPGRPGVVGPMGQKCDSITKPNYTNLPNWKQCTWTSGDHRDLGLIKVSACFVRSLIMINFGPMMGRKLGQIICRGVWNEGV